LQTVREEMAKRARKKYKAEMENKNGTTSRRTPFGIVLINHNNYYLSLDLVGIASLTDPTAGTHMHYFTRILHTTYNKRWLE